MRHGLYGLWQSLVSVCATMGVLWTIVWCVMHLNATDTESAISTTNQTDRGQLSWNPAELVSDAALVPRISKQQWITFLRPVWGSVPQQAEDRSGDGGCWTPVPSPGVGSLRVPALWPTRACEHPPQGGVHATVLLLRHHPHPAR